MFEEFKKIVDNCDAIIFSVDDPIIFESLGIDIKKGYSSHEIINNLTQNVGDSLKPSDVFSE